jgi:hypothetical protein
MVGREPIGLAGGHWTEVDLLAADSHLGSRRPPGSGRDILPGDAEHALIRRRRGSTLEIWDDQTVERCILSDMAAPQPFECRCDRGF